jgi:hypothetical protein
MKTQKLFQLATVFTCLFIASFLFVTAQKPLKVNSSGNILTGFDGSSIAIGSDAGAGSDMDDNPISLNPGAGSLSINMEYEFYMPPYQLIEFAFVPYEHGEAAFYPSQGSGDLGKSWAPWQTIYTTNIYGTNEYDLSDKRVKKNIRDIKNPVEIINDLSGKKYDYNKKAFGLGNKKDLSDRQQEKLNQLLKENKDKYGFIAQDVQTILPELVTIDDSTGNYYVSTQSVIPILVEAFQQQQSTIDSLKIQLNTLQTNCCSQTKSLKSAKAISSTEPTPTDNAMQQASLDQNQPNPFTQQTEIGFNLPETISSATLYIYNMQGKQTDSYPVNQRGNGSITIAGGTLQPGMYMYTLIADGQEVDTKRMILTE